MRTRSRRVWLMLLVVGMLGAGVKAAETPPWMTGTALSEFVAAYPEHRERVLDWLYGVIVGNMVGSERKGQTCAFIAGAGSKPRLDGGAGALQPYSLAPIVGGMRAYPHGMPPRSDIVIIIIDEFSLESLIAAFETLVDVEYADRQRWRSDVGAMTLEAFATPLPNSANAPTYDVPHGHLVFHHLLALLGGSGLRVVSATHHAATNDGGEHGTIVLSVHGQAFKIHLEPIDFDDVTTIRSALHRSAGVVDAVVVTSWGLVDCELAERYRQAVEGDPQRDWTIDAYLLDLFADSPEAASIAVELCSAFLAARLADAGLGCGDRFLIAYSLHVLAFKAASDVGWPLNDDMDAQAAVPFGRVFASAGNQRLPFPMPPAAWPGVIGVAACTYGPDRAWFSNVGDFIPAEHVVAPGAWFPVQINGDEVGYWGTSFAAPHAALELGNEALTLRPPHVLGPRGIDPCGHPPDPPEGPLTTGAHAAP